MSTSHLIYEIFYDNNINIIYHTVMSFISGCIGKNYIKCVKVDPMNPKHCTTIADIAAKHGYLWIIQNLRYKCDGNGDNILCTMNGADNAAIGGHLHVLKDIALYDNIYPSDYGINSASENGHLDVVQFCYEMYKSKCKCGAIIKDNNNNNNNNSTFYDCECESRFCCPTYKDMYSAISAGKLNIVRFLCEKCKINIRHYNFRQIALVNGHLDIADFLYNFG
jgi:hypothetical protein